MAFAHVHVSDGAPVGSGLWPFRGPGAELTPGYIYPFNGKLVTSFGVAAPPAVRLSGILPSRFVFNPRKRNKILLQQHFPWLDASVR